MSLRYFKEDALTDLRGSIKDNLARYRTDGFDDYFVDLEGAKRKLKGRYGLARLKQLKVPSKNGGLFEPENSGLVFSALAKLKPMQAREERIWAYLCHFDCLKYMRLRWPIPKDDEEAVKHIRTHFFASTARAIERDNGISRLWWMGFIASRARGISAGQALKMLMYKADVRANIIERPTTSASVPVFSAILRHLQKSFRGKKLLHEREYFRPFMKEVNSVGGVRLLHSLNSSDLDKVMDNILTFRLRLTKT